MFKEVKGRNKVVLFFPIPWRGGKDVGRTPYSVLYAARVLTNDYDVEIIDERFITDVGKCLEKEVNGALIFGVSSMTGSQIKGGIEASKIIRNRFPEIPIVWGGWHPSIMPVQTSESPMVDIVVRGQGELTLPKLLERLRNGDKIKDVEGITFTDKSEIIDNGQPAPRSIDEFPPINYSLIDMNRYIYKGDIGDRTTGFFASIGCPYRCTFCSVSKIYKGVWLRRTPEQVIKELIFIKENYKIDAVTFDDDNFFVNKSYVTSFCEEMVNKKVNLLWDCAAHSAHFMKFFGNDDNLMKMIFKSGCRQIYIGAESGSDNVLKIINKKAIVNDTYRFVATLEKYHIRPLLSTIVGFPLDAENDFNQTIDMIAKCKGLVEDLKARIFLYTPYPGTPLYETAIKNGMYEPRTLEEWSLHTLRNFKSPWVTDKQRKELNYFINFYFLFSSKNFGKKSIKVKLLWYFFYPLCRIRIRYRCFIFPFDAAIFFFILKSYKWYNRVFRNKIISWACGENYDYNKSSRKDFNTQGTV